MKELVKLIIVSHKRPKIVSEKSRLAFANAAICVEESQVDEYKHYNPDAEIIAHPDSVVGLSAKYKWLGQNFKNFAIIGDDIDFLRRNYEENMSGGIGVVDPETAYDVIQATAFMAQQLGCKLFAFSKENNPVTYSGHKPFRLSGIASGGVIGILDGMQTDKLTDRCVSGLDYFLSGLNAHFNRMVFVDERYFTQCKEGTFVSKGGMSDFRNVDTERNDFIYLKELFGDAIVVKNNENLRKKKHAYEKTLKVPF